MTEMHAWKEDTTTTAHALPPTIGTSIKIAESKANLSTKGVTRTSLHPVK